MSRSWPWSDGALAVDAVALAAVPFTPAPLAVVFLLYWIDTTVGALRVALRTALTRPRGEYSPTGPPVTRPNGSPGPLRFLIPKLGALGPTGWLPPVTPHNVRSAIPGTLWACLSAVVIAAVATVTPTPLAVPPTAGVVAVGTGTVLARHGWTLRRFCRSDRSSGRQTLRGRQLLWSLTAGLFVVGADTAYANAPENVTAVFTLVAVLAVAARVVVRRGVDPDATVDTDETTAPSTTIDTEPFTLSEPEGRPVDRFGVDRRAARIAGALDGLVPWVDAGMFNLWVRAVGAFLPLVGVFFGVVVADLPFPVALSLGGVVPAVAVGGAFVLAGVAQFELAFGAMEYRLYDETLVAYDTRLDAVQWKAPVESIHDVTVVDGPWLSPPGTDAGTVRLERSDLATTDRPYGFVRQSLVCVDDPERVADRIRRETRSANAARGAATLGSVGSEG